MTSMSPTHLILWSSYTEHLSIFGQWNCQAEGYKQVYKVTAVSDRQIKQTNTLPLPTQAHRVGTSVSSTTLLTGQKLTNPLNPTKTITHLLCMKVDLNIQLSHNTTE